MGRVCLIISYFGEPNCYFDLFINSASKNRSYDFYFYTDNERLLNKKHKYKNIFFIRDSLIDIKNRAQSILGFECILETPYKLCDYKPLYNLLYKESNNYEFWGFCDIDLVFGNISETITNEVLNKYSVIGRLGHFTIIKNEQTITSYYLEKNRSQFYNVFSNNQNFDFDEGAFSYYETFKKDSNYKVFDLDQYISDIRPQYHYLSRHKFTNKKYRSNFLGKQFYWYKGGKLYAYFLRGNEILSFPFMYAHFQKRPMKICKNIDINNYLIVPNMFKTKKNITEITPKIFKKLTKFNICEFMRHENYWFKFYLKALKNKIRRQIKKHKTNH